MKQSFAFKFSTFTALFTFTALVVGNLVVATNSGDACGTYWPKCNGSWIPNFNDYHTVIEYFHRFFTFLLGFVILINSIIVWKTHGIWKDRPSRIAFISLFLLLFQSLLGALNVMLNTPVGFTTLDVTFSLALFISLIILSINTYKGARVIVTKEAEKLSIVLIIVLYSNIILGAFFKHSEASKAVLGLDNQGLFSNLIIPDTLYTAHGILSTMTVIVAVFLFLSLRKSSLQLPVILLIVCIGTDIVFGFMLNVYDLKPIFSSIHMLLATVSLGCSVFIAASAKLSSR